VTEGCCGEGEGVSCEDGCEVSKLFKDGEEESLDKTVKGVEIVICDGSGSGGVI
jgi:hypothetical protein